MHKTIYLSRAGFTKAAQPSAPTNAELISTLVKHSGAASRIREYQKLYVTDDVENFLTRLDMDAASDVLKCSDRLAIEAELVLYFGSLRFTAAALSAAP